MENQNFENIPNLLMKILKELQKLNGDQKNSCDEQPVESNSVVECSLNADVDIPTHEQLKELCLQLNRQNPNNKGSIREAISKYTDGKLVDVPKEKLVELKADIERLS